MNEMDSDNHNRSWGPLNPDMADLLKQTLQEYSKAHLDALQAPMLDLAQSMQSELIRMVAPLQESIDNAIKQQEAAAEEIGPYLRDAGFWIPPSAPASLIGEIRRAVVEDRADPEAIRNIFLARYRADDHDALRYIIDSCLSHPYFSARSKALEAAFKAHKNSDYVLSVPTLLPILEGALILHLGGRVASIAAMAEQAANDAYIDLMRAATSDALIQYVTGIGVYGSIDSKHFHPDFYQDWLVAQGHDPLQVLNRHAILHGIQIDYDSEENSLRAFFLIDAITLIQPS
jgi:hypothetical protein